MPRFSVLVRWEDGDEEQGEYGWTGLAIDESEAEKLAREAMRNSYLDEQGIAHDAPADEIEDACEHRTDADGQFGGSVIEVTRGAAWQAQELEDALRAILPYAESRAEDMLEACGELDGCDPDDATRKAVAAVDAAKALLASLDGAETLPADPLPTPVERWKALEDAMQASFRKPAAPDAADASAPVPQIAAPRFCIVVEDGIIGDVISDDLALIGMSYSTVDYDVEGIEVERLVMVRQADGTDEEAFVRDGHVINAAAIPVLPAENYPAAPLDEDA